jgi:nucleotide-binding universal stress UspA family protein
MTGSVVVGLDGSPRSVAAAWWAAGEAAARNLPLVLLHSWTTHRPGGPLAHAAAAERDYGRSVLERAESELRQRYGDLEVARELVAEPAAQALLRHAPGAFMLVLGNHVQDAPAGFPLGSVMLHVLGHAPCPVVAVRAGDPVVTVGRRPAAVPDRSEIVVGLREPGGSDAPLLEFAYGSAQVHGAGLHAVHVLRPPAPPRAAGHAPAGAGGPPPTGARARLTAALEPWREKFPHVPTTEDVTDAPAAAALQSAAAHGLLTVIGRRRHPSRPGWVLGSVARAVLRQVPCPVAVVPHG